MGNIWADLRYGLRLLLRTPAFSLVAILTLALGVGANTAIFSVIDGVLLRPLPFPDSDRLVNVWEDASFASFPRNTPAPANFVDWRKRNRSFVDMAASGFRTANLTSDGSPEMVFGRRVTASFFSLLGVQPLFGRTIRPEEEKPDSRLVVLGHGLWQRRFGGDPSLIGRSIRMNGLNFTVIGVMPPGFAVPDEDTEFWVPMDLTNEEWSRRYSHFLQVIARLKPGVTVAQAQAEMSAIAKQLEREHPDTNRQLGAVVVPIREQLVGKTKAALWVLLAAAGAVLLIGCANLANLLLARSTVRTREIAVRTALGAGRGRLIGQMLTESLLLSLSGAAAGIALAWIALPLFRQLVPVAMTAFLNVGINTRVLLFSVLISAGTAPAFGTAPALKVSNLTLGEALKQGGRGGISGQGRFFRNALVVVEIALAVVLVVGAGLLIRTLIHLRGLDPGFQTGNLLTARVPLPQTRYANEADRLRFYEQAERNIRALPGVTEVSFAGTLPFFSIGNTNGYFVEGQTGLLDNDSLYRPGSLSYLKTLEAQLKEGRWFDSRDTPTSPKVVIINETFARKHWPGASPLGKRIRFGGPHDDAPWITVVGVIRDIRERGFELEMKPATYFPLTQQPYAGYLLVRTAVPPQTLIPALRNAIWQLDPEQPLYGIQTMDEVFDTRLKGRRVQMGLLMVFAGLALTLAAIGIYGVLAYAVSQRTREIGLRMALGAGRTDILGNVLRGGLGLALTGLAAGTLSAWWLARAMESLLFGVNAADLPSFAGAVIVLLLAALLACYIPARRAAMVDPMVALRDE